MVIILTYFPEVTEMSVGSVSELYWYPLFRRGISSMVMGGRLRYGRTLSTGKVLLKQ